MGMMDAAKVFYGLAHSPLLTEAERLVAIEKGICDAIQAAMPKDFASTDQGFTNRCKLIGEGAKAILDAAMPKAAAGEYDHNGDSVRVAMNLAQVELHSKDQPKSAVSA